jgi:hypothetical protein
MAIPISIAGPQKRKAPRVAGLILRPSCLAAGHRGKYPIRGRFGQSGRLVTVKYKGVGFSPPVRQL